MDQEKRRRLSAWVRGSGIEIGALHFPLEVPPYAQVRYVDRLTVEEQHKHYPELAHLPLAPVDIIATAEDLSPIDDSSVDFVIANHLLEHVEDPIRALREFERVLRPGGVVYLALPDKRFSFDRERELTSVEHLLREHDEGPEANRRDHYVDWSRHVVKAEPGDEGSTTDRLMSERYSIHFHCWDPDSFLDFLVAARHKTALDFTVTAFAPTESPDDAEFILILVKGRSGPLPVPPEPLPVAAEPVPVPAELSATQRWRRRLADTPLGPPVRAVLRKMRSLQGEQASTDAQSTTS